MKVMVLVKASKESEAGEMPSTELLTEMGRYNEELAKAGLPAARIGCIRPAAARLAHRRDGGDGPEFDRLVEA